MTCTMSTELPEGGVSPEVLRGIGHRFPSVGLPGCLLLFEILFPCVARRHHFLSTMPEAARDDGTCLHVRMHSVQLYMKGG